MKPPGYMFFLLSFIIHGGIKVLNPKLLELSFYLLKNLTKKITGEIYKSGNICGCILCMRTSHWRGGARPACVTSVVKI